MPKYLDCGQLTDPTRSRGVVHYNYLHLHYRRREMICVGLLQVAALLCNSHVNLKCKYQVFLILTCQYYLVIDSK